MQNFEELEEFDKLKTKVLKYVLYKKRTEQEVRTKFQEYAGSILDEVIEELKGNGYISDLEYINRAVNEFIALNNLSLKELKYKLFSKGLSKELIEDYIYEHKEELENYELKSANILYLKKQHLMEQENVLNYLRKKGYTENTIRSLNYNE